MGRRSLLSHLAARCRPRRANIVPSLIVSFTQPPRPHRNFARDREDTSAGIKAPFCHRWPLLRTPPPVIDESPLQREKTHSLVDNTRPL